MPHARSSCLPGLPTQRIQTAPLLFGIANATRRGYILKRVPPDNSHGISSARILARVSSRRGSIRIEGWGPRFWSAASRKLKKNLFPDFTLALFHTVSSEQRSVPRAAAPWFYYTPSLPSFAWWGRGRGESVHGTACDFAFGSGSPLFAWGRVGLLLRTPFHFFDTVFSFGNVQCCNSRSAAVFGILYMMVAMVTGGLTMV